MVTERKPPGMDTDDWVRYQIRTAEGRGSFRDLPLTGKPLPAAALRLDRDWVSELVQREQLDSSALLPLSITLAREAEQLRGRLAGELSERRAREMVVDLDDRIRAAYRQVLTPPMRTPPLDIDAVIERWRSARPADPVPAAGTVEPGPAAPTVAPGGSRRARTAVTAIAVVMVAALAAIVAVLAR